MLRSLRKFKTYIFALLILLSAHDLHAITRRQEARRIRIAVLDLSETPTGVRAGETVWTTLSRQPVSGNLALVDREQSRAAARGASYTGSLNLTLTEGRALAASIGCDFFITGRAEIVRRSRSDNATYYEAILSLFVVSARTGRLLMWDSASIEAESEESAEMRIFSDQTRSMTERARVAIYRAREDEETLARRATETTDTEATIFEEMPEEGTPAAGNFRSPQPFRRLRPPYTEAARRAEAEATVDATAEIDASGDVRRIEIIRWAGFGLDEAVIETIRQMHFRPAMRDGVPAPVRVLLRYNFRRPPRTERTGDAQ